MRDFDQIISLIQDTIKIKKFFEHGENFELLKEVDAIFTKRSEHELYTFYIIELEILEKALKVLQNMIIDLSFPCSE